MKKIRIITCLMTAALVAASFAGCGETVKTVDTSHPPEQEQKAPQREKGAMAKVVALDGNRLTVILAAMPGNNGGGAPPDGAAPPNGENGSAQASGAAVNRPGAPADGPEQPGQQDGPGQQGGGEIQFTGEEVTYTLSGDVTVTRGMGDGAAGIDLSELAADDVIIFTTTAGEDGNEVVDTIQVME